VLLGAVPALSVWGEVSLGGTSIIFDSPPRIFSFTLAAGGRSKQGESAALLSGNCLLPLLVRVIC